MRWVTKSEQEVALAGLDVQWIEDDSIPYESWGYAYNNGQLVAAIQTQAYACDNYFLIEEKQND